MKRLFSAALALLIFLVPSNLFLKLSVENAYVRGILVDYLIPKIYPVDCVILILVVLGIYHWGIKAAAKDFYNNFHLVPFVLLTTIIISQLFVPQPLAAFFGLLQLVKVGLLAWILLHTKALISAKVVFWACLITVLFQSGVGLYQFFTQHSLLNYYFLGEADLSYPLGLAREQVLGAERILAYGTTAHPNVLAGVLVGYLLLIFNYFKAEKSRSILMKIGVFISGAVGVTALWTTQSISAWMAFGLGFLLLIGAKRWQTVKLHWAGLLLVICTVVGIIGLQFAHQETSYSPSSSIYRRELLNQAAFQMIERQPMTGVGINQFTVQLENYSPSTETVRFIQPAHSVVLLWLAETGIIGLALILTSLYFTWEKGSAIPTVLLALIPIAVLDHYLLTLSTGLLVVAILIIYFHHCYTEKSLK